VLVSVQIPSVFQELPSSQDFYGRRCSPLTYEPVILKCPQCHVDLVLSKTAFTLWYNCTPYSCITVHSVHVS